VPRMSPFSGNDLEWGVTSLNSTHKFDVARLVYVSGLSHFVDQVKEFAIKWSVLPGTLL